MKTRIGIILALLGLAVAAGIWGQALPGTATLATGSAAIPYFTLGGTTAGPVLAVTPPPSSGWSWVNQGSTSTVTTVNGSLLFDFLPNLGNDNVRCYMRSLPASTGYTVDLAMVTRANAVGIAIGDGTKFIFAWTNGGTNIIAYEFTNSTSVGSNYFGGGSGIGTASASSPMLWMRIKDVGGARKFSVCGDADTCFEINSQASATFLTETQYGVCYETNQVPHGLVKLVHVSATAP